MTTINRSQQFVNRANSAVRSFRVGRADYESTMDLLTEHAHRVQRMNPKAAGSTEAQATALNDIYALMEWVQARDPETFESQYGDLLVPIGDGCYVTRSAPVDY